MQIIGHKSMNIHRIPIQLGTEIRLNDPFKCAKLQPDLSTHSRFMAGFAKCAKRSRRKNEEKKNKNFGRSYLGNGFSDFLQIWNVDSPT